MKTVTVNWQPEADRFSALGGHADQRVQINAPHQGPPTGFGASELLLAGAGACSAWDVVEILRKQRQDVTALEVVVHGVQAAGPPHAFETVELLFQVEGRNLKRAKVARAVELSEQRYCSVIATIRGVARVTCRVEVHEAAA